METVIAMMSRFRILLPYKAKSVPNLVILTY